MAAALRVPLALSTILLFFAYHVNQSFAQTATNPPFVQVDQGQWAYSGCYRDYYTGFGNYDLPYDVSDQVFARPGGMNVENCVGQCADNGYSMAGIENTTRCSCAWIWNPIVPTQQSELVPDYYCNVTCSGNSSEYCGSYTAPDYPGQYLASVYQIAFHFYPPDPLPAYPATVNPAGFQSVGCYNTTSALGQLANGFVGYGSISGLMTLQKCATSCNAFGYLYFGVSDGMYCYCDNAINSNAGVVAADNGTTELTCIDPQYACHGNSQEQCGGYNTMYVYSRASLPAPSYETAVYPGAWGYTGCYGETSGLTEVLRYDLGAVNSLEDCAATCIANNYEWMGVKRSYECYCDTYMQNPSGGFYTDDSYCNDACIDNDAEACGGPWWMSIYSIASNATYVDGSVAPSPSLDASQRSSLASVSSASAAASRASASSVAAISRSLASASVASVRSVRSASLASADSTHSVALASQRSSKASVNGASVTSGRNSRSSHDASISASISAGQSSKSVSGSLAAISRSSYLSQLSASEASVRSLSIASSKSLASASLRSLASVSSASALSVRLSRSSVYSASLLSASISRASVAAVSRSSVSAASVSSVRAHSLSSVSARSVLSASLASASSSRSRASASLASVRSVSSASVASISSIRAAPIQRYRPLACYLFNAGTPPLGIHPTVHNNSIENCGSKCYNHTYFGVTGSLGGQCYCGDAVQGNTINATYCHTNPAACPGNRAEACGNEYFMPVFGAVWAVGGCPAGASYCHTYTAYKRPTWVLKHRRAVATEAVTAVGEGVDGPRGIDGLDSPVVTPGPDMRMVGSWEDDNDDDDEEEGGKGSVWDWEDYEDESEDWEDGPADPLITPGPALEDGWAHEAGLA